MWEGPQILEIILILMTLGVEGARAKVWSVWRGQTGNIVHINFRHINALIISISISMYWYDQKPVCQSMSGGEVPFLYHDIMIVFKTKKHDYDACV